jgi:4-amino-4-deoxy-L-arabinose transferase-like glycosyltransferase
LRPQDSLLTTQTPGRAAPRAKTMLPRVPAPLAALLAVVAIVGLAWALLLPPWQSPDENSHFGYAQTLAERFELPGKADRPLFSSEQLLAQDRSNSDQTAAVAATKPEWSSEAYDRWRAAERRLPDSARGDGGGPNPASTNPPLYYLYETPAYLAASGGDIFDRLYLMRIWSVALLLVTAVATWLLAGELFGPVRPLQLVAAAFAGLQPMVTFVSASVTPDGMLFALWSIAFWLGVRILKRGLRANEAIALFAVVGLAVVTKATSYALLPGALLVLAVGVARLQAGQLRTRLAIGAVALLGFALPAGAWFTTARALDRPAVNKVATVPGKPSPTLTNFNVRELGSYMWQFYLPKLPFQKRFGGMHELPVYNVWLKGGWAAFGWLEVEFPGPVYVLLALITILILAGTAVAVVRALPDVDWAIAAFFAIAALTLLAGLHWTEFRTLVGGAGPFNQGRYLLPLISLMGAATAAATTALPARRRALAAGLVVGGLFVLQVFSLAIVGGRFYA